MPVPMSDPIPKTALITGAAKRIGRAIALRLAKEGWAIAAHYRRSADEVRTLVAEIEALGQRAAAFPADLANEAEVATLMPRASAALGPIGCLVNSASLFENDKVESVSRASWAAHMDTNLRAPFVLIQALAAQLPEEREGCVINITDQRVWNLTGDFVSYTLSKAGLWTLTQTLALALAPRIRVNAIGPGPVLPGPRQSEEQFRRQYASTPLKRGSSPEEIADAVLFLIAARAMTGQSIMLDGGQHLVRGDADQSFGE